MYCTVASELAFAVAGDSSVAVCWWSVAGDSAVAGDYADAGDFAVAGNSDVANVPACSVPLCC